MNIFNEVKKLVSQEKRYTALILNRLTVIEKQKLYTDLKYPSLFKYLCKGLGYSESEAAIRVGTVKLMLKDKRVGEKISNGDISLSNAYQIQKNLGNMEKEVIEKAVDKAKGKSTRKFKELLSEEFQVARPKTQKLILDERILERMERVKQEYGDISNYELIDILLEEKLKTPKQPLRNRSFVPKVSRGIPLQVKNQVYTGKCANCGDFRNLEYDHIIPFSKDGLNSADNMQLLCRNCNQRKGNKMKNFT